MSTEPTEFVYLPKVAAPALSPAARLGWSLTGITLLADLAGAINYWAALHAAHEYLTVESGKHVSYMIALAPAMDLNLGLAMLGACMFRSTAGRLTGSLSILAASALMVCSTLMIYGIPKV